MRRLILSVKFLVFGLLSAGITLFAPSAVFAASSQSQTIFTQSETTTFDITFTNDTDVHVARVGFTDDNMWLPDSCLSESECMWNVDLNPGQSTTISVTNTYSLPGEENVYYDYFTYDPPGCFPPANCLAAQEQGYITVNPAQ